MAEQAPLESGLYRLVFDTRRYFEGRGVRALYPSVIITFEVAEDGAKGGALSRAVAAQPVRLHDVSRHLTGLASVRASHATLHDEFDHTRDRSNPRRCSPSSPGLRRTNLAAAAAPIPAKPAIGSPSTASTAARICSRPTPPQDSARSRCSALDEYAPDAAHVRRGARAVAGRARAGRDHSPPRRRQADARAGRGLPHRLRGRLRQQARCRGGRPRAIGRARRSPRGLAAGTLPPFIGIRIKPMSNELHARSLRTLDLFVTTLVRATGRRLPPNFVVTIPKVMAPGHVVGRRRACACARAAR